MKRIIIIAVLAYLVYYLYNKKNAVASATAKGTKNNLDVIFEKLDTANGSVSDTKTAIDPSPAEISLVDPVGTSNANIAALQTPTVKSISDSIFDSLMKDKEVRSNPENWRYSAPQIVGERIPSLTGDTPYWMPNQEMIYPRGLQFFPSSTGDQFVNQY